MTLYIHLVATKHRCKFHEEWKGRIDPWQPKRKQRKKAAKSTKNLQQATSNNKGDAMSVPKVFYGTSVSTFCQPESEAKDRCARLRRRTVQCTREADFFCRGATTICSVA